MQALVNTVPLEDSLGPAVAELIVDNCPLPSKQDIQNFLQHLRLNRHIALAGRPHPAKHRNICKSCFDSWGFAVFFNNCKISSNKDEEESRTKIVEGILLFLHKTNSP